MTTHTPSHDTASSAQAPGSGGDFQTLPGHWVLARMGKRVLRPGGRELTQRLLQALDIGGRDDVVEFAPGLGATARLTLAKNPASYTAIERDENAAATVRRLLGGPQRRCLVGQAQATTLPDGSASVVYGEAMLTMHTPAQKAAIAREAFRVLRKGGRYGIHEIALVPDNLAEPLRRDILQGLSYAIRVGVCPQSVAQWNETLAGAGFRVCACELVPMHLLEPKRLIQDEGFWRALRFAFNVLRTPEARARVSKMREVFRRYGEHLSAIMLVAEKP